MYICIIIINTKINPEMKQFLDIFYCIQTWCYFKMNCICKIYNINEVFLGQIPDRIRARVPFDLQTFRFPALRFLRVYYYSTFTTHKNRQYILYILTLRNKNFIYYYRLLFTYIHMLCCACFRRKYITKNRYNFTDTFYYIFIIL